MNVHSVKKHEVEFLLSFLEWQSVKKGFQLNDMSKSWAI